MHEHLQQQLITLNLTFFKQINFLGGRGNNDCQFKSLYRNIQPQLTVGR